MIPIFFKIYFFFFSKNWKWLMSHVSIPKPGLVSMVLKAKMNRKDTSTDPVSHPELPDLVFDEDAHKVLVLFNVRPVVLLGDASVLPGREPQVQADRSLHVWPGRATFQLEPLVNTHRRNFLEWTTDNMKRCSIVWPHFERFEERCSTVNRHHSDTEWKVDNLLWWLWIAD